MLLLRSGLAPGGYGAALEQRPRHQLRVVPGGGVADAGEDEEAGAGGTAVRLRWSEQTVLLAPGDRHRHVLGVAGGIEDVAAHRPGGGVVALAVEPADDELAGAVGRDPLGRGGDRLEGGGAGLRELQGEGEE